MVKALGGRRRAARAAGRSEGAFYMYITGRRAVPAAVVAPLLRAIESPSERARLCGTEEPQSPPTDGKSGRPRNVAAATPSEVGSMVKALGSARAAARAIGCSHSAINRYVSGKQAARASVVWSLRSACKSPTPPVAREHSAEATPAEREIGDETTSPRTTRGTTIGSATPSAFDGRPGEALP